MTDDLNHVTLTGVLEKAPFVRTADSGLPWLSFSVKVSESRSLGETFKLFVPVEAYGTVADQTQDLSAGDSMLVAGKLKWSTYTTKSGEKKSSLAVLARLVKVLQPPRCLYDFLAEEKVQRCSRMTLRILTTLKPVSVPSWRSIRRCAPRARRLLKRQASTSSG